MSQNTVSPTEIPLLFVQRMAVFFAMVFGKPDTKHRKFAVILTIAGFCAVGLALVSLLFFIAPLATAVLLVMWSIAAAGFFLGYKLTIPHGGMEFSKELTDALRRAERGEAEAMIQMAAFYRRGGHGLPPNPGESVWWLRKAAMGRSADAAFELAGCFERGEGAQRSARTALSWYEMAASAGHVRGKDAATRLKRRFG